MFTQCTNCQAIAQVTPREIKATNGFIRCSKCDKTFDSTINLSTTMQAYKKTIIAAEDNSNEDLEDKNLDELSAEHLQIISALDDWQNASLYNEPESSEFELADQANNKPELTKTLSPTLEATEVSDSKNHYPEEKDFNDSLSGTEAQEKEHEEPTEEELLQTRSSLDDWQNVSIENILDVTESNLIESSITDTFTNKEESDVSALIEDSQHDIIKKPDSIEETESYSLRRSSSKEDTITIKKKISNEENALNLEKTKKKSITTDNTYQDDILEEESVSFNRSSLEEHISTSEIDDKNNTEPDPFRSKQKYSDDLTSEESNNENGDIDSYSYRRSSSEDFSTEEKNESETTFRSKKQYLKELFEEANAEDDANSDTDTEDSYSFRRSSSEEFITPEKTNDSDLGLFHSKQNTDDLFEKSINDNEEIDSYKRSPSDDLAAQKAVKSKELDELNSFGFRRGNVEKPLTDLEKRQNDLDDPFGLRRDSNFKEKTKNLTETLEPADTQASLSTKTVLKPELHEKESTSKSNKAYPVIAMLLAILLSAQIAFNYRHTILDIPKNAPEQVHMLNHNIFAHPIENNVLLISATIENQANFDQLFPTLEVRLNNTKGELFALRRFSPMEYLETFKTDQVFSRQQVTTIKLKIKDPGNQATRFQFNFL